MRKQLCLALCAVVAVAQTTVPGVVYFPDHRPGYPLSTRDRVNATAIAIGIDADLATLAPHYQLLRTYRPSFHGVAIAPIAARHNLHVYLGLDVGAIDYATQVDAVITALQTHPSTVDAIIVGSDSLRVVSTDDLVGRIEALRSRVQSETSASHVKLGTAQHLEDWLDPLLASNMSAVEAAVDIVGVNYFPGRDASFDIGDPVALINGHWPLLQALYPSTKLTITETGYPTASLADATTYFNAFKLSAYSALGFYYAFFDRQPRDPSGDVDDYGLYTIDGTSKKILPDLDAFQNESSAFSSVIAGACYSPFHLDSYPLNGVAHGSLSAGMDDDFKLMKKYVGVVRTYYSTYMGVDVTPIAAKNDVPLYLGVFMTDQPWYANQVNAAIQGAIKHPSTVKAILVGNENVIPVGPYSASYISSQISYIRSQIAMQSNGKVNTVLLGTVQRVTDWLNPSLRTEMKNLADNSDIIGVNIYPFFDNSYDSSNPTVLLNALWDQMAAIYPASKLRLTETGFATGGPPSPLSPRVVPSLNNAITYYMALSQWQPSAGGGELFWYTFFDLRADDRTQPEELEKYFGFFTAGGQQKVAGFPPPYEAPAFTLAPALPVVTVSPLTSPPARATPAPSSAAFMGANYDPFHNAAYPSNLPALGVAITQDLAVLKKHFNVVRTVYTNFYGIEIAPYLAAAKLDVYLGVFMTREGWYTSQVNSAISAVRGYGGHIRAILVGNENINLNENFSPSEVAAQVVAVRSTLRAATSAALVMGTAQRAATWLTGTTAMRALANACDVIGVTYQPYLDGKYDPANPTAGLDLVWTQLKKLYPASKLRLVDVTFPSAPVPSPFNSVATLALQQAFYNALLKWVAINCPTTERFWGTFFDNAALRRTGGLYTAARLPKSSAFPLPL
ncbi:hypothetical protein SPRG_10168 [Saprolegnia parasitica CBS 223.65]|uniref:glucan endo-1,3-beta-D-glucosidase n=1 Tax=Saprolegnia parasitica (strain CBS 223.65) TaxID=695850 RepID=A0A067CDM2_SAPPC|nr:hypothetical protein SPRG_10168 [Saprolegnia parasitica CBS 223.65]KDO24636.1 hypothetical protein SPRG_10168 [Saprolegnia parasitica CBS 223.65]|eukprot:XP_012204704.1 hypothetical protein SPRG_10168 [Saprolegnia parasitica CBS 223.65]